MRKQKGNAAIEIILALVLCSAMAIIISAKQLGDFNSVGETYYRHMAHEEVMNAAYEWQSGRRDFVNQWETEVASTLPSGQALVEQDSFGTTLSVRWEANPATHEEGQYQYRVA